MTDNVDKTLKVKWSDKVCPNHQANQQMFFSQTPVKAVRLQTCVLCGMPVYRPTYFLSTKLHNLMTEAMWCEKLPNGLHAVVGNRTRTAQMQVRFTIIVHHHAILRTQQHVNNYKILHTHADKTENKPSVFLLSDEHRMWVSTWNQTELWQNRTASTSSYWERTPNHRSPTMN